jgi:uncharacterized DUF497 family protein
MKFEWDPNKALANYLKHGISFDEATTVFKNSTALVVDDTEHSEVEDRRKIIGHRMQMRVLVVIFTIRHESIRIISARKANEREKKKYRQF